VGAGGATGVSAGAAGRIDIFPVAPRIDTAITGYQINVTTAVASSLAKVVVYDSDALGRPVNLLYESGDMDCSTVGVKTAAISMTLRQDKTYWLGLRFSGTASVSTWPVSATPDVNGGTPSTASRKIARRTLTYSTAASTTWGWNSSEVSSSAAPAIWLRV
jgi:hypothetical protein